MEANAASTQGLRVGLTGGLGSGKSTAARLFHQLGAHILSADDIARDLMQPCTEVFRNILAHFGEQVLREDGTLDRPALARLAFAGDRIDQLNRIIHPATIARQAELAEAIFARDPHGIVIVESALIFETRYSETSYGETKPGSGWRNRFDHMILVTAPDTLKIERFVTRALAANPAADPAQLAADARRRLAHMIPDAVKAPQCDFVLSNEGTFEQLQSAVSAVWQDLKHARNDSSQVTAE